MNSKVIWKQINHPDIHSGYLVSPQGYIKAKGLDDDKCIKEPSYHATNGYDFVLLYNKDMELQLFPIDDIIAMAYIPIPSSLKNKPIKVSHINGDTRDISLINLQWIEDIEEWRSCTFPGIVANTYEVSSHGRMRNTIDHKICELKTDSHGYFRIIINKVQYFIHRLIVWEFYNHDELFNSKHVNHINGFKKYNIPKNLEVVSLLDNVKHAHLVGLNVSCDRCHNASVSNDTAKLICELIVKHKGNTQKILSELQNNNIKISNKIIYRIKEKESWNIISDKFFKKDEYRSYPQYSAKDVIEICKLNTLYPNQCKRIYDIAHKKGINISLSTIKRIVYKRSWTEISDKYF
jgi:hypothetical protein